MKKGDIVLIPFPFSDLTGNKLRPAVVLFSTKIDVLVSFISTQFKWQVNTDIIIESSNINGLKKNSLLKIGKIATIDKDLVLGKIGTLEQNYISQLNKNLIKICKLR